MRILSAVVGQTGSSMRRLTLRDCGAGQKMACSGRGNVVIVLPLKITSSSVVLARQDNAAAVVLGNGSLVMRCICWFLSKVSYVQKLNKFNLSFCIGLEPTGGLWFTLDDLGLTFHHTTTFGRV